MILSTKNSIINNNNQHRHLVLLLILILALVLVLVLVLVHMTTQAKGFYVYYASNLE
jgi:flagellar biogenesis protein FliO